MVEQDHLRGRNIERAIYSTVKGVFGKTMTKAELVAWVAEKMGVAPAASKIAKMGIKVTGDFPNGAKANGQS
jgi:hypothetical protein